MKKVLSSILVGTMLISSMGAISIFADETETSVSATAEASSETSSTETELGEAIGKLKENITKLEVKSFWERNKGTILKVTGGVVAAAATAAALYFGNKYLGTNGISLVNPELNQTSNQDPTAPSVDPAQDPIPAQDPQAKDIQEETVSVDSAGESTIKYMLLQRCPIRSKGNITETINEMCIPEQCDAGLSISTNQNLFANSTETLNVTGAAPSASQAEDPSANQINYDEAAFKDLESAYNKRFEPAAQKQFQEACKRYIAARSKVGVCNPLHLSKKEDMCLINDKDTGINMQADKLTLCESKDNDSTIGSGFKKSWTTAWRGISNTASTVWKTIRDFDDAAEKSPYSVPIKCIAYCIGILAIIHEAYYWGLIPISFANVFRGDGAAAPILENPEINPTYYICPEVNRIFEWLCKVLGPEKACHMMYAFLKEVYEEMPLDYQVPYLRYVLGVLYSLPDKNTPLNEIPTWMFKGT
ncbi:MAG: hypothetical protein RUMPE_01196 [Eubacteriales bacterium SKADARSKE-1]|nr:hypothetical protein [Eubacteriales bacterium SKADARSKE-1]MDQ5984160.1 hypothetical protein [Eubacteriales bacterium SKADARSKE-1]